MWSHIDRWRQGRAVYAIERFVGRPVTAQTTRKVVT